MDIAITSGSATSVTLTGAPEPYPGTGFVLDVDGNTTTPGTWIGTTAVFTLSARQTRALVRAGVDRYRITLGERTVAAGLVSLEPVEDGVARSITVPYGSGAANGSDGGSPVVIAPDGTPYLASGD